MLLNRYQNKIETSVLVTIQKKMIRAFINPMVQETTIGKQVAELIESKTRKQPRKTILRRCNSLRMVYCIEMELETPKSKKILLDGIIDHRVEEKVIVLGMQAIKALGFKFWIGGQLAKVRTTRMIIRTPLKNKMKRGNQEANDHRRLEAEDKDEDEISFLDEEEAARIRDWKY